MTHILFLVMTNIGLNGPSERMLEFSFPILPDCFLLRFLWEVSFVHDPFSIGIQPMLSNIQQ